MYRPFEQPNIGNQNKDKSIEESPSVESLEFQNIPDSLYADDITDMIETSTSKGAWESLIEDAEKELESLESQKRLIEKSGRIYNGEEVSSDRMQGILKEIVGKIEFQKSIIDLAKNNL